jgi:hypothetical protein
MMGIDENFNTVLQENELYQVPSDADHAFMYNQSLLALKDLHTMLLQCFQRTLWAT